MSGVLALEKRGQGYGAGGLGGCGVRAVSHGPRLESHSVSSGIIA